MKTLTANSPAVKPALDPLAVQLPWERPARARALADVEAAINAEANTYEAEVSADDLAEAAALLNAECDDYSFDGPTPPEVEAATAPADEDWQDQWRWELGPEPDAYFDALYSDRLDSGELDDFDCCGAARIG